MQLLRISITNAKYELTTKSASLDYNLNLTPSAAVSTTQAEMSLDTKPAKLDIDTYQARKSIGFANSLDFTTENNQKVRGRIDGFIVNTVKEAWQMAEAGVTGVTYGQIVKQKMMASPPSPSTVFLPGAPAEITYQPDSFNLDFKMGQINTDWQIHENKFDYMAASLNLKITQKPRVDIEYTGGPIYMPKSANPALK